MSDKSELDELLDNARKEKDTLESEVAHLKKQLALSKNEIEKLKEQVSILQEECKVTRNNARTTQSDLEYKCEKLMKEKIDLNGQIQEFQEALNELQVRNLIICFDDYSFNIANLDEMTLLLLLFDTILIEKLPSVTL